MSNNDPKDVESSLQVAPQAPAATPTLTGAADLTSPVGRPGLSYEPSPNAVTVAVVPPTVTTGLTRKSQNGIAGGTENPRATQIDAVPTPPIVSSASPVAVGAPTLATAGPAQGSNSPRVAGVQLVSPTPPTVQTASTLSQPANAPQALQGISTMKQGS